jgi:hypothetical protein
MDPELPVDPVGRANTRCLHPLSEEQLLRGWVLALFLCALLAVYGRHEGMEMLERSLAGLARTCR